MVQGENGPIKTALLCEVHVALIPDSTLLFHFDSDMKVHYVGLYYTNIRGRYRLIGVCMEFQDLFA